MKAKDVKDLSVEELRKKESDLRDEIFRLKVKRAANALENKMAIRNRKRDLARIATFITGKTAGKA